MRTVTTSARLLAQAIEQQRILEFYYHDLFRRVQPYIVGRDHRGHDILSAVQVAGGSSANTPLPGWKTFHLNEMRNTRLAPETFRPDNREYNPQDPHFETIYAQIRRPDEFDF